MAKTSKINRQLQRERMVAKYAERRAEYKRDSVNPHLTAEERAEAMRKLQALPHDASPPVCATAIPSTAARAPTTASSACHVSICVRRHTRANCPAW